MSQLRLRWEENTSPTLAAAVARDPVVVLPVGSIEQHGNHIPVGCDANSAEAVALRAAAGLEASERPVLVLPTLWYGYSPHHMAFAGTVTLRSETFLSVVQDVVDSVLAQGVRRAVILNGHGGNVSSLDVVASRLGHAWHGKARIVAVTYFHLAAARQDEFRESEMGGMGHACEFETSLQLAIHPELVDMKAAATCYPRPPSERQSTRPLRHLVRARLSQLQGSLPDRHAGRPRAGLAREGRDDPAHLRGGTSRLPERIHRLADDVADLGVSHSPYSQATPRRRSARRCR